MRSKWIHKIVATILMLIKLITTILQRANIKSKRLIEKVSVEQPNTACTQRVYDCSEKRQSSLVAESQILS